MPKPPLRPCGTMAAYRRHKYYGEPACDPCQEAIREYERKRYATGKRYVRKTADPKCGTVAGYHRHRREGENTCEPCREANREYQRKYQRAYQQKRKYGNKPNPYALLDAAIEADKKAGRW